MATINDIANVVIDDPGPVSGMFSMAAIDVNIVTTPEIDIITVPQVLAPEVVEVAIPGLQGPPGLQNVYVGPTPPSNPQVGWVWIQTS